MKHQTNMAVICTVNINQSNFFLIIGYDSQEGDDSSEIYANNEFLLKNFNIGTISQIEQQ